MDRLGLTTDEFRRVYGESAFERLTSTPASSSRPRAQGVDGARAVLAAAKKDPTPVSAAGSMQEVSDNAERIRVASDRQDVGLRKLLALWSVIAASSMLGINSIAFGFYLWSQWGEVPEAAIIAWLSASLVEVLGIVYVVAAYLFPKPS